jgi:hypothetical protein
MVAVRKSIEQDTQPDGPGSELADAVEWLKRAGIVHHDKPPPFSTFFDEDRVANSGEGEPEE